MTKCYLLLILVSLTASAWAQRPEFEESSSDKPVKVFVLAGQSNMQGKGFPEPLVWQLSQQKYRDRYQHLIRDGDFEAFLKKVTATSDPDPRRASLGYDWSVRHDVWINYLDRRGGLSVGFGNPERCFGPELNFGHVMGDHFDEQVLIIKTAWGGRALAKGFLPPSSMASDAEYARQAQALNEQNKEWNDEEPARIEKYNARITEENKTAERKKRLRVFRARPMLTVDEYKAQYGVDYRAMVDEVHTCLRELGSRFSGYRDQGYELAGFVWFQGWNDQYKEFWHSYERNLENFIRDVRKEFQKPQLPFVIGQMGQGGTVEASADDAPRTIIKRAQAAVAKKSAFRDNTICVPTDVLWDMDAHAIYIGPGGWREDVAKWRQFGNDRGYHYYGSPWFFAQAGTAFGEAMLQLLQ
ncbi:MAG: sialate O-acetylesterase [Planctomycetota bacterium]